MSELQAMSGDRRFPTTRGFILTAHGGPEVMQLVERETPTPGTGEILIEIEVAGVNFGDTMIRRGEYLRDQPLSMAPGCEAIGRVLARGAGVDLMIGSRVAAWIEQGGAYASHALLPAYRAYPIPEDLPAGVICALFFAGTTAWYGIHRFGQVRAGESVLIHGAAGAVGGIAVQLAKHAGAIVLATASSTPKREATIDQGADLAFDSTQPDELASAIRDTTGGRGCDVVIDGVGGRLFDPSLRALAARGRYVIVGSASQTPAMFDARRLLPRNQTVCGFILHHIVEDDTSEPTAALSSLCDLVRRGALTPRFATVSLDEAPRVHREMEERTLTGKVVLRPY